MGEDDAKLDRNAELTEANASAIAMFRADMAASEEKRESKLNGMTVILDHVVKVLDQITFRMDTPQIGMTDRQNAIEATQKEMTKILGEVQAVLTPLVESAKLTRKYMDLVIGGVAVYILTRLLPFIGQLLQVK